jgi:hypothetical protein
LRSSEREKFIEIKCGKMHREFERKENAVV